MLLTSLSSAYGAVAAWRRQWYADDPSRRLRLTRPVVSVGNLRVGGTGKTPVVEHVARMLVDAGWRPAILTRGYARRIARDGVTVVSDGSRLLAGVDTAGDEPLMLARALGGVIVLVGADRYLSGRLAERQFGATVHILDDGFQHLRVARDVDLLLAEEIDLGDVPLPAGRLRERVAAAAVADAAIVNAADEACAQRIARALGLQTVFRAARRLGAPRPLTPGGPALVPAAAPVVAVAGVARPERFFADVAAAGWNVAGTLAFPDHHRFTARDIQQIAAAVGSAGAAIALTTEKDAVRLAACDLAGLPIAAVPLTASVEPAAEFRAWLLARLARPRHPPQGTSTTAPEARNPASEP